MSEDLHKQEPGDRKHTNGGVSQHLPQTEKVAEQLRKALEDNK